MKFFGQRDQARGNVNVDKTTASKGQKGFLQASAFLRAAKELPVADLISFNNEVAEELDINQVNALQSQGKVDDRNRFVSQLITENPTMNDKEIESAVSRYDANIK